MIMMGFAKAIDSVFKHMGTDGTYQRLGAEPQSIRVILRQPDPVFELGDRHVLAEHYRIDVRVSEWALPQRGDCLTVNGKIYSIEEEPKQDQHQLVWLLAVLPLTPSTQNNTRLRLR